LLLLSVVLFALSCRVEPGARLAIHRQQAINAVVAWAIEGPAPAGQPSFPETAQLASAQSIVVRADFVAPREVHSADDRVRRHGVCPWECGNVERPGACVVLGASLVRETADELELLVSVTYGPLAGKGGYYIFRWYGERLAVSVRQDRLVLF
jgi:hypothetical protein